MNFALIGVAGYVAGRHLEAIKRTNGRVLAAVDPHDSVGLLDRYAFDINYFKDTDRFRQYLHQKKRLPVAERIDWVSVCSPNYLHYEHCQMALDAGISVICEKPLVIHPGHLNLLKEAESQTKRRVHTILQLRLHPTLRALKEHLEQDRSKRRHQVSLTYITPRGRWYYESWKGSVEKSGGIAMNIGIHFFDLLLWLFGEVVDSSVTYASEQCMAGILELRTASIQWFLSLDQADLPQDEWAEQRVSYRSMTVDGEEVDFTDHFTRLHTLAYEALLAGLGFGINDARPAIELACRISTTPVSPCSEQLHPFLLKKNARA